MTLVESRSELNIRKRTGPTDALHHRGGPSVHVRASAVHRWISATRREYTQLQQNWAGLGHDVKPSAMMVDWIFIRGNKRILL